MDNIEINLYFHTLRIHLNSSHKLVPTVLNLAPNYKGQAK